MIRIDEPYINMKTKGLNKIKENINIKEIRKNEKRRVLAVI